MLAFGTNSQKHYRITREEITTGALSYYDFYLTLSDLVQGAPIVIDIPYVSARFTSVGSAQPTPQELDRNPIASSEVSSGHVFKLLYMTAFEINGEISKAEIPATVDFDKIYTLQTPSKQIKFIYYRLVAGKVIYSSLLGNESFPGQYNNSSIAVKVSIDTDLLINIISQGGIDYYIIKVSPTPNIIMTGNTDPSPTTTPHPTDGLIVDEYENNDIFYKLVAIGNAISGKGFQLELSARVIDPVTGQIVSLQLAEFGTPFPITVVPDRAITIDRAVASGDNTVIRILATEPHGATSVNFRVYV